MKNSKILMGLVFALVSQWAGAVPMATTGDSGHRGDAVSAILSETNANNLDTLWVDIGFDPSILSYTGIQAGSLNLDFVTVDDSQAASGMLSAILSSPTLPISGVGGSVFEVLFDILSTATYGDTTVTFQCHDTPGLGCVDYPFDPVEATITVLRPTGRVPLPATPWLLALGLPLLAMSRARR